MTARPRVVIVADVRNWAWARKASALATHLADEFQIEVVYQYERPPDAVPLGRDLYHTFEVFQLSRLSVGGARATTGITAHVWPTWERQHGPGTVRRWAEGARAFHANSLLLCDEMKRLLDRKIHYCPNGVDETFFRRTRPRQSDARLVVGWVGKPNPRKGREIVAEACARAGVELRTVERRHTTALSAEAMREFYQDLHVLAVASDMDGTPNPALEAAACGVAVVGNRIGNLPEFIIDGVNGRMVQRDSLALASALRVLALDIPRAVAMGGAARASIEAGWTWKRQARNYAALWREALA
jgi:glycosyltransferase involved in cell wall biosynthesis